MGAGQTNQMYLGVPTLQLKLRTGNWELKQRDATYAYIREMKWNEICFSAASAAANALDRAGELGREDPALLCSCDPAHMLPAARCLLRVVPGLGAERGQQQGLRRMRMRPWWLLAASWKTQYLNNLLPCERTSSTEDLTELRLRLRLRLRLHYPSPCPTP